VPGYIGADNLDASEIVQNQFLILLFLLILFLVTLLCPQPRSSFSSDALLKSLTLTKRNGATLALFGLGIFALELGAQLYAYGWSIGTWIAYSTGPRGVRGWSTSSIGGSDFLYAFLGNIFSACPFLLPLAIGSSKGLLRIFAACGLAMLLFMLFFDGSRTPVALTLLVLALVWQVRAPNFSTRIAGQFTLAVAFVAITAVMVSNRDKGYADVFANKQLSEIKYGQDDNYYQLLHIMQVADSKNSEHWNSGYFFAAVLLNPVPRYFWPGKPLLTQDFYGEWKVSWATVSYAGECVAMFGKGMGLVCALFFGFVYYHLLLWSYRCVSREFGVVVYLAMSFYIYMAQRSIHDLGTYVLSISTVLVLFMFFHFKRSSSSRMLVAPITCRNRMLSKRIE
jgi:hypothetical protein